VFRICGALLALSAFSCATSTHGTHERIAFDSSPQGADVEIKCEKLTRHATTPATIEIPRNAVDCVATISKDGFKTTTVPFDRSPSHVYWVNFIPISVGPLGISDGTPLRIDGDAALTILLTGIVGMGLDAFDGAMFKHEPASVKVTLEPR
jgi:hypothetical protein